MTYNVSISGTNYPLPSQSERNWSAQVNAFFVAIGQSLLSKAGGSFTLTAEVDFGANFGLAVAYLKSKTAGSGAIASAGWMRLSKIDRIAWRNILDTADIPLSLHQSSGRLQSGVPFQFYADDATDVLNLQPLSAEKNSGRIPSVGERVQVQSFAGTGLTVGATYWVTDVSGYTLKLYTTEGGPSYADITVAGLGYLVIQDDLLTSASTDTIKNKKAFDFAYDSEAASITSETLSTTSGKVLQRITASSANLSQINHPTDGKLLILVNETASDITIKHNNGVAGRAIYTPGALDFVLKVNAAALLIYDPGLLAWVLSGGSGSGGSSGSTDINLISSPNDASGWGNSGSTVTAVTTTTTAELPLAGVIASAIKIAGAAGYARIRWTMPTGLKNWKIPISWYQLVESGYASGDFKLDIYTNSASDYSGSYTRKTLSTDVSTVTGIPAVSGFYGHGAAVAFEAANEDYYEMRITRVNGTKYITLANVKVGPGELGVTPAVGSQQVTVTGSWVSNTTYTAFETQIGRWAEYIVKVELTGAPTATGLQINLPSGRTIDTSIIKISAEGGNRIPFSVVGVNDNGVQGYTAVAYYASTTAIAIGYEDSAGTYTRVGPLTNTAPITFGNGDYIIISFKVPIAEWAGSVSTGPAPAEEFASCSGTWDANSTTTVYGPAGQIFGGTLTSFRTKTITWQYPIQASDEIVLEASTDGIGWHPLNNCRVGSGNTIIIPSVDSAGVEVSGAFLRNPNTTTTEVGFGRYANMANDDTPVSNWPSTGYWRVRKTRKASLPYQNVSRDASGLAKSYSSLAKIRLHTGNGYGSTNTAIRRFATVVGNTGTGITYTDSATAGASFTCTEDGIYSFSYNDNFSGAAAMGLSLNSSQLTTSITSITAADRLIMSTTAATSFSNHVSITIPLAVGDVVRPHGDGTTESIVPGRVTFAVQRLA